MDVEWWKQSNLPIKQIIGMDGRIVDLKYGEKAFESLDPELAQKNYSQLIGLKVKKAREKIVELLGEENSSVDGKKQSFGQRSQTSHSPR